MFAKYFIDPVKNHYLDFAGRATRTQFWAFVLFRMLIGLLVWEIERFVGGGVLSLLVTVILFCPEMSITARRLRDGGFPPMLAWVWIFYPAAYLLGFLKQFAFAGLLMLVFSLVELIIWIFCLFPSKD